MTKTITLSVLLVAGLFGFFIWPTPYEYVLVNQGTSVRTGRIERWDSSRVRFLSSYGCRFGNGELAYGCLSKERQKQIELNQRAEEEAGSGSESMWVATEYGRLLVDQVGGHAN